MTRQEAVLALSGGWISPKLKETKSFQRDFIPAWKRSEEYTRVILNQMPEEWLDFRYTPESFTFRTQFVHCITFTAMQLTARLKVKNPYMHVHDWDEINKSELDQRLAEFYAWVERLVGQCTVKQLAEMQGFSGDDIPMWRLFYALENHIIHHRGQAICYLRLKGITPQGYVGW